MKLKNLLLTFSYLLFTIYSALLTIRCYAQDEHLVDSLLKELPHQKEDSNKVNLLNKIGEIYGRTGEFEKQIQIGNQAKELALKTKFLEGEADAFNIIGYAYLKMEEYPVALSNFNQSIYIYEKLHNEKKEAHIHHLIGYVAQQQSNFAEALKQYLAEIKYDEKVNDRNEIAEITSTIGNIYNMMGNRDESIKRQLQAIAIYQQLGNKLGIAKTSNNLGLVYDQNGRHDEGLKYLNQALAIANEMGNPMGKAICLGSIANHYHEMEKYPEALDNYLNAVVLFENMGDKFNAAATYINIGEIYTELKQHPKAREYLNKGLTNATQIGAKVWIANSYIGLTKLDSLQGNFRDAMKHYQLYISYRDSITNDDNIRKTVQVQMQYDFDKKEASTKAEQEKKDAIALKELQRQKFVRNSFVGGFIIVLLFASILFSQRNKIKAGKKQSDELLLNILPAEVAEELKAKGSAEAQLIDEVTVLFTDFKGFTELSEKLSPKELVAEINECFSAFDHIMQKHGIEKIKTIGDAYMAAGGLPTANKTHAFDVVSAAVDIQQFMHEHKAQREAAGKLFFEIRIGVHTGPVVAGIVGVKKFAYDIWGDTVNTASRMESSGEVGKVNISGTTYELVKDQFKCEHRGKITAKGKGEIDMYFVEN